MKNNKTIGLACDHAGYELKEHIKAYLTKKDYDVKDYGTYSEERCDYPDFAHALARGIEQGEAGRGIAVCGSGEGINITLNKHQQIRAALAWTPEIARLARQHNDANVLAMPGRFVTNEEALEMVKTFLSTEFEGGRHQKRVDKISVKS